MKSKTTQLADIPLPKTDELERQVITDAISNPDALGEVSLLISDDSFTDDSRKLIWHTIIQMYSTREPIDLVSVWQKTGQQFIDAIQSYGISPSTTSGFLSHAALLHVAETKRRAYFAALTIVQQSASAQTSEDEIFAAADNLSKRIQGERQNNSESPLSSVLSLVADETEIMQEEAMKGRSVKVVTSLSSLDYALYGGFGGGQLIILAARPSVGKTALMLQFAKSAAASGVPSMVFSLEMTKEELGKRLLFSTGYVTQAQLAGKNVDWEGFERARTKINSLPLYINDEVRTLPAIEARITSAVSNGRCGIAFIDYLGLMRFELNSSATLAQQIGFATSELKSLAKRLKIPIVVLVQLNREMAKEASEPQLYHLRDSGSIEQDADVVLMLAQNGNGNIDLWIRKNRNFKRDVKLELHPDNAYTRFLETATPDWVSTEQTTYTPPAPTPSYYHPDEYNAKEDNFDF